MSASDTAAEVAAPAETALVPMSVRTVKVSNVSLGATEQEIKEFFSFSGDIEYIEMKSFDERSQVAYVTFKDTQGAETALLLSGATIVDLSVSIEVAEGYELPPAAQAAAIASSPPSVPIEDRAPAPGAGSPLQKAEDVVSSMLAKGFVLGRDALNKAKSFDERHQLTSTASAKVTSFDKKIGLSEKVTLGASAVNEKVKDLDQKFQVSEKTKTALTVAEQKVSDAGNAILSNRYVLTGASWVVGAFNRVSKAAGDVTSKAKEKVMSFQQEGEKHGSPHDEFAQVHLSGTGTAARDPSERPNKPPPAQGLIL